MKYKEKNRDRISEEISYINVQISDMNEQILVPTYTYCSYMLGKMIVNANANKSQGKHLGKQCDDMKLNLTFAAK